MTTELTPTPVRRRRVWQLDLVIAVVIVAMTALVGWTLHLGRGSGLGLIPIGRDGGGIDAAVTVRANFPTWTLEIPRQGITAPIDREVVKDGFLGIPDDIHRVGWYTKGGQLDGNGPGSVLIDGHVNWVGQGWGALGRIGDLQRGDVVVTRGAAKAEAWRVISSASYLKDNGLPADIFRSTGERVLTLITCGGTLNTTTGNYNANIVVQLQPVTTLFN